MKKKKRGKYRVKPKGKITKEEVANGIWDIIVKEIKKRVRV
jgi:hypothetical protein